MSDGPLKVELKINFPHPDHKVGSTILVDAIAEGVPADPYWRRRIRDADHDDCVEVITKKKKKKKEKAATEAGATQAEDQAAEDQAAE